MENICKKSNHPNIHICEEKPNTQSARKTHRIIKRLLKKIQKKERRRGKWINNKRNKDNRKDKLNYRFKRKVLI